MPLSPADFYAYSQATGAPVADTPEKRAQQAPEVLAFRQQQLQTPKEGGGLLDTLGKIAVGAGLAAGGYGLVRYLRNRGVPEAVQKAHIQDLGTQAEETVRRAAAYQGTAPSRVATTAPGSATGATASPTQVTQKPNLGVQMVDISKMTADSWHSDAIAHAIANEASLVQNQPPKALPPAGQRPDPYATLKNYTYATGRLQPPDTLVDQQHNILPNTVNQSINAVTSAEDQVTNRRKHLLQQNPHMDMSQIELMEEIAEHNHIQGMEQDEPMHQVATQALGHTVVPQEETTGPQAAQRFFQQRREELAAEGIRGLRAEQALAEPLLPGARYVEGAEGYEQRQQKKGLTLALQTGDPNILKVFQTGELPPTVKLGAGASQLGEVPTSEFLTETTLPEAVEGARQRHAESTSELRQKLQDIHDEISAKTEAHQYHKSQAENRVNQIDEQLMMIEHSLGRGRTSGSGELLGYRGALTAERNQLGRQINEHQNQLDALNYRLNRANEVYGGLIGQVQIPQTLKSWSDELLKVSPAATNAPQAGFIDPATGEFKPSTHVEVGPSVSILTKEGLTLGSAQQAREMKAKGGGGRNVAEYVAGNRPPEAVDKMRGGGRMRDYDPITGGVQERYQPDLTQTEATTRVTYDPKTGKRVLVTDVDPGLNRAVDVYGTRLATQAASDPNLPPSKVAPSRVPLGPQKQQPTEAGRQSIDLSRTIQGIYASGRPTAHQEVQALVESLKRQQNLM